jgi:hypothetical protein
VDITAEEFRRQVSEEVRRIVNERIKAAENDALERAAAVCGINNADLRDRIRALKHELK